MANDLRKLNMKLSRSHSWSPTPQSSIHQSGNNAAIAIQGSYSDVWGNQIIVETKYV